jgi:hypothetical protein
VRDEEAEKGQEVEVAQRVELVGVPEGQSKEKGQRSPDIRVVGVFAVGAVVAAGHLPADLVPGPHVVELPGLVVHPDPGDLLALAAFNRRPAHRAALLDLEVDRPLAVFVLGVGGIGAVPRQFILDLGVGEGEFYRLLLRGTRVDQRFGDGIDLRLRDLLCLVLHCEHRDHRPRGLFSQDHLPRVARSVVADGGVNRGAREDFLHLRYGLYRPAHLLLVRLRAGRETENG